MWELRTQCGGRPSRALYAFGSRGSHFAYWQGRGMTIGMNALQLMADALYDKHFEEIALNDMAKKFAQLRATMFPESQERAAVKTEEMLQEMALAELRRARQLSQAELANILGIRQPSVADMEKRTDMYISTLRNLIEGMGGELDIIARFPGKEVRIKNFTGI